MKADIQRCNRVSHDRAFASLVLVQTTVEVPMACHGAVALVPHPLDRKVVVDDEQASRPHYAYGLAVVLADVGEPYRKIAARVDDIELNL